MSRSSDIPGFYYDDNKRRYFRILPTAHNADREDSARSNFVTSDSRLSCFNSKSSADSDSKPIFKKRRVHLSRPRVLESMRTNSMRMAADSKLLVRGASDCRAALTVIETSSLKERCRVNIARAIFAGNANVDSSRSRSRADEANASSIFSRRGDADCQCTRAHKLIADVKHSRMLIIARSGCAAHSLCGLYRLPLDRTTNTSSDEKETARVSPVMTNWTGKSSRFLAFALVRDDVTDACSLHFSSDPDGYGSVDRQSVHLAVSNSSLTIYSNRVFDNLPSREEQQAHHVAAPRSDTLRCCAVSRRSRRVAVCSEASCRVFEIGELRDAAASATRHGLTDIRSIGTVRSRNVLACSFIDGNAEESRGSSEALLLGTKSGSVCLCDLRDVDASNRPSIEFKHSRAISQLQPLAASASDFVVASDYGGSIRVWDVRSNKQPLVHIDQRFNEAALCPFSINEEASVIVTTSTHGQLCAYRLWNGRRLCSVATREPVELNRPLFLYSARWPANVGAHALLVCQRNDLVLHTYF